MPGIDCGVFLPTRITMLLVTKMTKMTDDRRRQVATLIQ